MNKIKFKKEFWCIVTARKNSKSIKRKNLVKIKNKELVKFSFDEIKKIKNLINKTIITTDDPIIKKISKKYNYEIVHRNRKISGDSINSVDVIKDVLKKSLKKYEYLPKYFFLIQPTSIFLKSNHIKKLVSVLKKNKFKSAQTIIKVPHQFHAFNQRHFNKSKTSFVFEKKRMKMHNKQIKPIFYAYGNLIACETRAFLKKNNFFAKPSFGFPVSNIYGFDLDNKFDLKIVKQIMKKKIKDYE